MWFKKKANISGYNSNTAADGSDWRTNGNINNWPASNTLPSAADANKYFYLPALDNYGSGQLTFIGDYGEYWSSSAYPAIPGFSGYAYGLQFGSGIVIVLNFTRSNGYRVEPSFE